jgi:hypothetical protein
LPFRIRPGAPSNSIYVAADGKIGLGTATPSHALAVMGSSIVSGDGNVLVDGYVTELSSVHAKQNFSAVNGTEVLEALAEMPIQTWSYRTESEAIIHMGPTAQDFYSAFQLGPDERHIASIDSTGVALAAIQGLNTNLRDSQAEIAALEAQNTDLETRLSRLEAAVDGREDGAESRSAMLLLAVQVAAVAGFFLAGLLAGKRWKGATQHVD